jgi:hypothetical protein
VIPLEQEISKAAAKHFPRFQHDYGPWPKSSAVWAGRRDRVRSLESGHCRRPASPTLRTRRSAWVPKPPPFTTTSSGHSKLSGFSTTASTPRCVNYRPTAATSRPCPTPACRASCAGNLRRPGDLVGAPGQRGLLQARRRLQFAAHAPEGPSARCRHHVVGQQQKLRLKEGVEDLQRIPEWEEFTQEERGNTVERLDSLALAVARPGWPQEAAGA